MKHFSVSQQLCAAKISDLLARCLLLLIMAALLSTFEAAESWFEYAINDEGTVTITGYNGPDDGELVVPGVLGGITVTVIGRSAFRNNNFHTVRISENIKWISTSSFRGIGPLRNVYLPASLEHIMRRSFVFPAQFHVPEENEHFRSVDGVLFTKDMTRIKRFPSTREGEYTIPGTVTSIRGDTFRDSQLSKINIPDGVTIIGRLAFNNIEKLTEIRLPKHLNFFNDKGKQFAKSHNLKSIIIPDGVTDMPRLMFSGCTSLSQVTLPKNLESLGYGMFLECVSLVDIAIPEGVRTLSRDLFRGCNSLASITLPDNLQAIDEGAFRNCTSLVEIVIPASVSRIGGRTGGNVFSGCDNLRKVFFLGDAPEVVGKNNFPVRRPGVAGRDSLIIYHTAGASGWPQFGDIMEWQGVPTRVFNKDDL